MTPVKEPDAALAMVPLKEETSAAAVAQADQFIADLLHMDVTSGDFRARVDSAFRLGRKEIGDSALLTGRFMEKDFVGEANSPAFKVMNEMRSLFAGSGPGQGRGPAFAPQDPGHDSFRQAAGGLFAPLRQRQRIAAQTDRQHLWRGRPIGPRRSGTVRHHEQAAGRHGQAEGGGHLHRTPGRDAHRRPSPNSAPPTRRAPRPSSRRCCFTPARPAWM